MTDKEKDKLEKEEEGEEKPLRVQFGKDATSQAIADGIRMVQDNWALKHPATAYELYPSVYDENGKRIRYD